MDLESSEMVKRCAKCSKPLIVNGVHMGVPFGHLHNPQSVSPMDPDALLLVCTKCYDEVTVDDQKVAKRG